VRFPLVLTLLLLPSLAAAIPEEGYAERYVKDVEPHYLAGGKTGFITGKGGVTLSFVAFEREEERGALVYLPGRGGSHVQAMEFFYDMRHSGYSMYAFDHRGQGLSDRMLDNRFKGHVDSFQDYVDDVKLFMDEVVNQRRHEKVFLMGLSMGGAVATAYAEQHSHELDGLILLVPMHQPNYGIFDENAAAVLGLTGVTTGNATEYAVTQGDPSDEPPEFEDNRSTSSRARWEHSLVLHKQFPDTVLGGVTYGWGHEVVKATRKMRNEARLLTMPVVIYQAGQDQVVMNNAQDQVCNGAPRCRLVRFEQARHGILNETDDVRDAILDDLQMFMAFHEGRGTVCSCSTPGTARVWTGLMLMVVALLRMRRR